MRATVRLLVVLAAVWGGSMLVPAPARGGYYEGQAARVFLEQQAAMRREAPDEGYLSPADRLVIFGAPLAAVPYGEPVPVVPYPGPRILAAPWGWGGGSVLDSSLGSWTGIGGFGMGLAGASRSSWSGPRMSWRFGGKHEHPTSFLFSNRGFLGYSRGPWSFAFGW